MFIVESGTLVEDSPNKFKSALIDYAILIVLHGKHGYSKKDRIV